jgi:hypothetical protein
MGLLHASIPGGTGTSVVLSDQTNPFETLNHLYGIVSGAIIYDNNFI